MIIVDSDGTSVERITKMRTQNIFLASIFLVYSIYSQGNTQTITYPEAYYNTTPPVGVPTNPIPMQSDVNGNLRTILSGTTYFYASPSGQSSDGLQIAGGINPAGACEIFKTSPGNIFTLWGVGPPGLYIEVIDATSAPTSPTTLSAEPAANAWIGGGQIGARGEWNYNSGEIYPEATASGVTVCISTTAPPLYTQYAGLATVIMNGSVK